MGVIGNDSESHTDKQLTSDQAQMAKKALILVADGTEEMELFVWFLVLQTCTDHLVL